MIEQIYLLSGEVVMQRVEEMPGDGSCLFHAISFCTYGTRVLSPEVRHDIVDHVVQHWDTYAVSSILISYIFFVFYYHIYLVSVLNYQAFTYTSSGDVYGSAAEYEREMRKTTTYGGHAEINAAAEIFSCRFEVYQHRRTNAGMVMGTRGEVYRLRYTGQTGNGHYDAYVDFR